MQKFIAQNIQLSQNFSRYNWNDSRKQVITTVRAISLPNKGSFMFFQCKVLLAFHWHKNIKKSYGNKFLVYQPKKKPIDIPTVIYLFAQFTSNEIASLNSIPLFQFLTNKTLIKWRISRNVHCARVCYQINWWSSGVFFSVFSLHCILVVNLFSSQIIRGFQSLH